MLRIVGVGGEPCTGKSTLFKALMKSFNETPIHFNWKLTKGLLFGKSNSIILGEYPSDNIFGGTDRLAMNCQPDLEVDLRVLAEDESCRNLSIYFEGDRLFNYSFIKFCHSIKADKLFCILETNQTILRERRSSRSSKQNVTWLQGRRSKLKKIYAEVVGIKTFYHNTPEDTDRIVKILKGE